MAYTARLAKQQLRQRRDATRDRSRDNTKGTVQYLVTYAHTNNNCLLCASNIIVSVAIPTWLRCLNSTFFFFFLLFRRLPTYSVAVGLSECRLHSIIARAET